MSLATHDVEAPEFVVIHFFRAPTGELRCRATDVRTRDSWLIDDPVDLRRRVCARSQAPARPGLVLRNADDAHREDRECGEEEQRAHVEKKPAVLHCAENLDGRDDSIVRG